jgi:hypothetical protein
MHGSTNDHAKRNDVLDGLGDTGTVFYCTKARNWSQYYLHYAPDGAAWTQVPGVTMDAGCTDWVKKTVDLGSASTWRATFDNGSGTWDNNGPGHRLPHPPRRPSAAQRRSSTTRRPWAGRPSTCTTRRTAAMSFKRRCTDTASGVDSFALATITDAATFTGVPDGRYADAVTGDVRNVTDGTLAITAPGKGVMRVYVLDLGGENAAPGKIGTDGPHLKWSAGGGTPSLLSAAGVPGVVPVLHVVGVVMTGVG